MPSVSSPQTESAALPTPPSLWNKEHDNKGRTLRHVDDDDDGGGGSGNWGGGFVLPSGNNATKTTGSRVLLPALGVCLKSLLGVAVTLYVLNQKHLLPLPLSRVVSKVLFWPSLPLTIGKRLGHWTTPIDDTVIMGGAPFGFAGIPEYLKQHFNVRGVINLCEEYPGPMHRYRALGMTQLHLPTADHFEPCVRDLERAVEFIRQHQSKGHPVYVHCRAGHGRSAAVVMAWLLSQDPSQDMRLLNAHLCRLRNVRKTLWKQPNLKRFHAKLLQQSDDDDNQNQFPNDDERLDLQMVDQQQPLME